MARFPSEQHPHVFAPPRERGRSRRAEEPYLELLWAEESAALELEEVDLR